MKCGVYLSQRMPWTINIVLLLKKNEEEALFGQLSLDKQ